MSEVESEDSEKSEEAKVEERGSKIETETHQIILSDKNFKTTKQKA